MLPRRVPGYQPAQLDQLCASGEVVWVGAGLDRVALFFREDAAVLGRRPPATPPEGDVHDGSASPRRSAEFWYDLLDATGLEAEEALPALWELVWAGEVTNDAWTPLRAGRRYGVPKPERAAAPLLAPRATGDTATQGRWSLTDRLFAGEPDRRALAELLLERQGIVTRDGVRAEGIAGGYGAVYGELKALETLGVCRRGYFVEGLGGAQFALARRRRAAAGAAAARGRRAARRSCSPRPIRRSRTARRCRGRSAPRRAPRVAGAHVVLLGGEAALFVERGGRSLVPLRDPEDEWLRLALAALVEHVKRRGAKRLAVERFDGEPVGDGRDAAARRGRLPRGAAPRRPASVRALGALAAVVLLAGCGADPPEKVGAERAVARQAHAESADCTSRSRILFKEV